MSGHIQNLAIIVINMNLVSGKNSRELFFPFYFSGFIIGRKFKLVFRVILFNVF